jgi:hypothetical protein
MGRDMSQVNNTYLDVAIDRVKEGLLDVSSTFDPPVVRVAKYVNLKPPVPIWWIYPGSTNTRERVAAQMNRQVYPVALRLILGVVGSNYDGRLEEKLWVIMPTVINYFDMRRGLIITAGQKVPKYLDVDGVAIEQTSPYGVFDNNSHIGIEFTLTLPFTVSFPPVLGNH